jgi:hypothetical protein
VQKRIRRCKGGEGAEDRKVQAKSQKTEAQTRRKQKTRKIKLTLKTSLPVATLYIEGE